MTAQPVPSAADLAARDGDKAWLTAWIGLLRVLVQIGVAAAGLIGRAAGDGQGPSGVSSRSLAGLNLLGLADLYCRVARAVRLAVALLARLEQELATGVQPPSAVAAPDSAYRPEGRERPERAEGLETLLRPEFSKAFLARPVDELVGLICRDLGLDPRWTAPETAPSPQTHDLADIASAAMKRLAKAKLPSRRPRRGVALAPPLVSPLPMAARTAPVLARGPP